MNSMEAANQFLITPQIYVSARNFLVKRLSYHPMYTKANHNFS